MKKKRTEPESGSPLSEKRRKLLKGLAGLPLMAGFSGTFVKNLTEHTADAVRDDSTNVSGHNYQTNQKVEIPKGRIGNLEITRLIMGCNLISGYPSGRRNRYQCYIHHESEFSCFP
jgi:hypothetical protein